jgi:hypothetical protein
MIQDVATSSGAGNSMEISEEPRVVNSRPTETHILQLIVQTPWIEPDRLDMAGLSRYFFQYADRQYSRLEVHQDSVDLALSALFSYFFYFLCREAS